MPKTLFEWDDYIFGLALHLYAPQADVPQAPFFPLFVHAARLARVFARDDAAALSSVSVLASVAALVFLGGAVRELFGSFRARGLAGLSLRAVAVYAFLPAVWFYAGTPISDTAGAAASLGVLWLALRALREPTRGRLVVAFAAFGAACGVRPQSLVPVLLPLGIAWLRSGGHGRGRVAALAAGSAAALACAVVPVVAAAGGLAPLVAPLRQRLVYTGTTTSIFSGVDGWYVARRWLRDPWVSKWLAVAAAALMIAGAVCLDRRDREAGRRTTRLLLASFAPYALLCVVFLDPTFGSRYLLPVMPLAAIFIAAATGELERALHLRLPLVTAAFVTASVGLVAPAIAVIHRLPAPAETAAARLRARAGSSPFALLYPEEMFVPTELLFPGVTKLAAEKTAGAPDAIRAATSAPVWRFGVGSLTDDEEVPCWPALPALARLTPGRYLAVPVGPWSRDTPAFGAGWSAEERVANEGDCGFSTVRWISAGVPARAVFPAAAASDPRVLYLVLDPDRGPAASPSESPSAGAGGRVGIEWNGESLGSAPLHSGRVAFRAPIPGPPSGRPEELTLQLDPGGPGGARRAAVRRLSAVSAFGGT